jgi:hypothetical protein
MSQNENNSQKFVRTEFVAKIERELKENSKKKGDWHTWQPSPFLLASELNWHLAKLLKAIETGDRQKVSEHAADCAAYAMKADEIYGAE